MFLVMETPETTADPDTPLEKYMLALPRQAGQNLRRAIRAGQRCQCRAACVEEIPHPQNNQQDFNSLIAKFTDTQRESDMV